MEAMIYNVGRAGMGVFLWSSRPVELKAWKLWTSFLPCHSTDVLTIKEILTIIYHN